MRKLVLGFAAILLAAISDAKAQVMVVGDSQATAVSAGGYPQQSWPHLLMAAEAVDVRSVSAPGLTLENTQTQTLAAIDLMCGYGWAFCDRIVLQRGINDAAFGATWSGYVNAILDYFNWARSHGKRVLMLDLIWAGSFETGTNPNTGKSFSDYRTHRYLTCLANSDVCDWLGRTAPFDQNAPSYWTNNHPNAAGHIALRNWLQSSGLF